jgi:hypothetical protein
MNRSPNHTRGRTPCAFSSTERVSVAWVNTAIRLSRHSSWPRKYGELAASATWTPARHCAAFQWAANVSGPTCRCSCTLVQAASGAIVSAYVSRSSTPLISMCRSSPRAARICSSRSAYLGLWVMASCVTCSG